MTHLTTRNPQELKPHPQNDFDPELSDEFTESVRQFGIRYPIRITADNLIVSGKRRWLAAKAVGMTVVPVEIVDYASTPDGLKVDVALGNVSRPQTNEFKARLVKKLAELLAPAAAARQKTGVSTPDEPAERTMIAAAKEVGWSAGTARKAMKVLDAIQDAAKQKDWERTTELREQLEEGSVDRAFRSVSGADTKPRPPKKPPSVKTMKGHLLLCRQAMSKLTQAVQLAENAAGGPSTHSEKIRKAVNAIGLVLEAWRQEI